MPILNRTDSRSNLLLAGGFVLACLAAQATARAQVSLTSAVDLALSNSPRVKIAASDVARAKAGLDEAKDAFIPTVVGSSSGAGYSSGFPLGTPTVFNFSAQSLVFSYSQRDYIRSANENLAATSLALKDVREQVAEDTAVTYLTLTRDQQERDALAEEAGHASRLEEIVKDRLDAGQDSRMDYTKARRTGVQIRLQLLQLEDAIAVDTDHLTRLIGMAGSKITADASSIPKLSVDEPSSGQAALPNDAGQQNMTDSAGVAAAFATARAKRQQAFGDSRYIFRPQISFGAQYSRFSTYNNTYVEYYPSVQHKEENAVGFALSITIPVFDAAHKAKARGALADADHAQQQALLDRDLYREGRVKLQHNMAELSAHAELAALDRELAQEQLDSLLVQLQAAPGGSVAPMTPKDEQNARILERQRYIDLLEAEFQLHQAAIHLLRQTGELETWLAGGAAASTLTLKP